MTSNWVLVAGFTINVNVSSSLSAGTPPSVTVTLTLKLPASPKPGAQSRLPVPLPLSVSEQNRAFASEENKEMFEANPEKYAPAYGGWCAYGVAVGKKFVADPEVWTIVKGKLYVNLDRDIQAKWNEDIPGHIKTANANWVEIQGKAPADL